MTNVLDATSMKQAQPRHMRNIHTIMWLSFLQKSLMVKFGLGNFSVFHIQVMKKMVVVNDCFKQCP